jgi:hypothetical protein
MTNGKVLGRAGARIRGRGGGFVEASRAALLRVRWRSVKTPQLKLDQPGRVVGMVDRVEIG